jgi:hypothetical protein
MRLPIRVLFALLLCALAMPAFAQSPNTASVTVVVVDQSGAVVKDVKITVTNTETGATRDGVSGSEGSATFAALPLTGQYKISVSKEGFTAEDVSGVMLRATETATVKIKLMVSGTKSEVTVYGTTQGSRDDAQLGNRVDSATIDETPILGRKITSLPLLDSAFRQGKGLGDLFVNATYVVTGGGSRRTTTYMLDGSNDDEGWGRQMMVTTVPAGSVQEISTLTNAFSAEFGWTSGPAMNIVTKSGTNKLQGEVLYMGRPGGWQNTSFSTKGYCPPSISSCTTPSTLTSITPVDIPDSLKQGSGTLGGALVKDKTFFFVSTDYTNEYRTTQLSNTLPSFVLDSNGDLTYVGHYRQELVDARIDQKLSPAQTLMFRANFDHMFDTNPNDAVIGTTAPSAARKYERQGWSALITHTSVIGSNLLNEARVGFTDGDPVTKWSAIQSGVIYQRTAGAVPFKAGANQVSDLYSRQLTIADTLSWSHGAHMVRFGGSLARHMTGGVGTEPGQALNGTFTFNGTGPDATLPFAQLTLADVQSYSQPYSFGAPAAYTLNQWLTVGFVQDKWRATKDLTLDLGLRYDRQSTMTSTKDFAPRIGFGWHPGGNSRFTIRGGYGMYYTQVQSNVIAGYLQSGLDGFTTYTATPGQAGFPTCLSGACLPVSFSSNPALAPARNITIISGKRAFYTNQFAQYGLNFSLLPNYSDTLASPRSQNTTIGVERQIGKGVFVSADYEYQYWNNLVRTVDLNAPSVFVRTAPGQVRTAAAANLTRPIVPVAGGVTQVNAIMNLGYSKYNGLTTEVSYRGNPKMYAAVSYTLSKAMNTSEPDGNGNSPNDNNITQLGSQEWGPSIVDQRHRAVITFHYLLPLGVTFGTVTQLASARPINPITGVDNNGDGSVNDRPIINGVVAAKNSFRGTGTQDVSIFLEKRVPVGKRALVLRLEGFNMFNHPNLLGHALNTYGDTGTPAATFGAFAAVATGATTAIPAFANIDPPRMYQFQARFIF